MIKVFENKTYVLDNARIAEPNEQVGLNEQKALKKHHDIPCIKSPQPLRRYENLDIRFDSMSLR